MNKRKDEETIFLKIKNINTDKEWQKLVETDVSNLKGTVVNFSVNDFNNTSLYTHVWIELDIKHKEFDCDEWGNAIQFNLLENGEYDGGTSVDYLKKAKLIEEQN